MLSLDPLRLSDIRALYPNFESLFQRHVKNARFDDVSKRSQKFKTLKIGVISLLSFEEKHGRLPPATRPAFVQAIIVEDNVELARQLVDGTEQNGNGSSTVSRIVSYLSGSRGGESFRAQMKTAAAKSPDSQFLQWLESTDDQDLRSTVQSAKALAHEEISRSIDKFVSTMTHAVLEMQQDKCKMAVQTEVDKNEKKALNDTVVEFIRQINTNSGQSAGQRTS